MRLLKLPCLYFNNFPNTQPASSSRASCFMSPSEVKCVSHWCKWVNYESYFKACCVSHRCQSVRCTSASSGVWKLLFEVFFWRGGKRTSWWQMCSTCSVGLRGTFMEWHQHSLQSNFLYKVTGVKSNSYMLSFFFTPFKLRYKILSHRISSHNKTLCSVAFQICLLADSLTSKV